MQAEPWLDVFLIPVINRQLLNAIRRVSELEMEQGTGEGRGGEGRETAGRYQVGGADVKALMFSSSVETASRRLTILHSAVALSCPKHQEKQLF